jgi:enolase-phosphatase E1
VISTRAILLDIEGTTTPISFVHDVLFSYARSHARDYLTKHSNEVAEDLALLRQEHAQDVSKGEQPPIDNEESVAAYVNWLIDRDRKSTGLKSLQGKIWRQGYLEGTLKAQVFDDVAPAFELWHEAGLRISIFSSGSVLAQQLLFAHTDAGDLTKFISDYFDTNIGAKGDPESYRRIAQALNLPPTEILFISDVTAELVGAREAGMKTLLSIRPGNQPQPDATGFQTIQSFDDVTSLLQSPFATD